MAKEVDNKKIGDSIEKILSQDKLKDLANKIVSEDIDSVILIYRDKKSNELCWETTINQWATLFGSIDMVKMMLVDDWRELPDD